MRLKSLCIPLVLFLTGCVATPPQSTTHDYIGRAESQVNGKVRVKAVVLSPEETRESFQLPLADKGIQPVWIEIDNQEDKEYLLFLLSLDPEYFSPSELAWIFKDYGEYDEETNQDGTIDFNKLTERFARKHIPVHILPRSKVSGFIYTNIDPGAKAFAVELIGGNDVRSFDFMQVVPGFIADYMRVNFQQLYPPQQVRDVDLAGLRKFLDQLPCCTLGGDKKTPGDPLNLVLVGNGKHALATLIRRGWDLTETIRSDTVWRTISSSIFRSHYRTSPVSPLYLFDRPQDIALQKSRGTAVERNHLRLWLAPVTLKGKQVWVGQISRDIGIKFSSRTVVTHKIDPVVDEARLYISMDIAASQTLQAYGYVKGVGYSDRKTLRFNYTGDPYYTDGLRVVLILSDGRSPLDDIKNLHWEEPLKRLELRNE